MLYLYLNKNNCKLETKSDYITVFDYHFDATWLESDLSKKIIEELDECTISPVGDIVSVKQGVIEHTKLSTRSKLLLLMLNVKDILYQSFTLDEECSTYLEEITKQVDVHIYYNCETIFTDTQVVAFKEFGNIKCVGGAEIEEQRKRNQQSHSAKVGEKLQKYADDLFNGNVEEAFSQLKQEHGAKTYEEAEDLLKYLTV